MTSARRRVRRVVHDELLTRVLALAVEACLRSDHPFGALLAVDGRIGAEAHDRAHTDRDMTARAELVLVRQLERASRLGELTGGTVYASRAVSDVRRRARLGRGSARRGRVVAHSPERAVVGPVSPPVPRSRRPSPVGPSGRRVRRPRREDAAAAHVGSW